MEFNNIIIFDGICNLCNASVQFIIKHDKDDMFRFLPLQSAKAKQMINDLNKNIINADTVVLIQDNKIFTKSEAALRISKYLGSPWKFFYFFKFIPKFIRDWIYEVIAQNRYQWFGKRSTCMVPTEDTKSKFLVDEK